MADGNHQAQRAMVEDFEIAGAEFVEAFGSNLVSQARHIGFVCYGRSSRRKAAGDRSETYGIGTSRPRYEIRASTLGLFVREAVNIAPRRADILSAMTAMSTRAGTLPSRVTAHNHPRSLALRTASVRVRQLRFSSRRATCISTVGGLRLNCAAVSLSVSPAARRSRTSRWRRVGPVVWSDLFESRRASSGRAPRREAIRVASRCACRTIAGSPVQFVRRHCIQAVSSESLAFRNNSIAS